jgi:hypothetical protein
MHLCTKTPKCEVNCSEPASNGVEGVHRRLRQGGLRIETQHQSSEIAAVILQLVFTIHFDEGENLNARSTESVM